jgi:hypothetical protein
MTTQVLQSIQNYTANITSYNGSSHIAVLDQPVNVSLGINSTYGDVNSTYTIQGLQTNIANAISAGKPLQLATDEAGNFIGIFNVPPGTFQTGSRVFRLDNRTVMTDQTTATTYAEATFTASGLATNSQQLDFAPSVDSSSQTFTQVSQLPSQLISTITTYSPYDPIAQTFMISQGNYPNGAFLNGVKLFFQSKPSNNVPITVSIIPTLNGYPTGGALSYSTVTLQSNQVVTSSAPHYLDPTTYTEFMFEAPVYVQPGVLYAVMIKASSPDYTLYYAQQNQIAIPSTAKANPTDANPTNPTKVGAAPYIGALFESQNSITWTADQTKDLMFVLDQCVFQQTTATVPFVVPQGLPYRKVAGQDLKYKLDANTVSNLYGNFSPNRSVDALNVSTTDFSPTGTEIGYSYQATLKGSLNQTPITPITPGQLGTAMPDHVYLNDGQGERVLNKYTSNSFSLFATMTTNDPNVSPIISDDGVSLFAIKYIINNMGIGNNVISVVNGGTGYGPNASITITNPDTGSSTPALGFTTNTSGSITNVYSISPGAGYLTTPTITIYDPTTRSGNANAIISVHGETDSSGGNSYAKYFTKKVVLAPGNDSGDLRVYLAAYQPLGTGIYVYYKILSSQDSSPFESGKWQLMTCTNNFTTYSTNRTNVIEYEYAPGVFLSNQANNTVSYTNTSGQTFTSFNQFAIKVVLASDDPTNVPYLSSLTAIALPPGTGM